MESEVKLKKTKLIMNKILFIIATFFSLLSFSQQDSPTLENFQKKYIYSKSKNYKGPTNTNYSQPAPIENGDNPKSYSNSSKNKSTINYSPQQIQKNRAKKQNSTGGNGIGSGEGGNKPNDPEMGKPKPIEFDTPELDAPDLNLPDIDPPGISANFWKILMIIIIVTLVLFLVYYLIKNHKPTNKKLKISSVENDWNPELISKTELELRLEEALLKEDYRECVRIYFTFILKEMIRLNRISWKKDLTNYDYVLQAKSHLGNEYFEESVRIYDLVWYGEYQISKKDYAKLENHLKTHYIQLTKEN